MKAIKRFKRFFETHLWNYVICGRGELPRPQRQQISRVATWQESLSELQGVYHV